MNDSDGQWLTMRDRGTAHFWSVSFASGFFYARCGTYGGQERADLREPYVSEPECKRCKRLERAQ